jgi:urease accessory protein
MKQILRTALVICLLVLTTPAWAHAPIMGIRGVFGGVLHALLIPEHGASLVALGLVLGRQQQLARRSGLLIFAAALACGLVATGLAIEATLASDALLVATGILGLLIAAGWGPPILGWPLAAIAGLAFALDSAPETTSTDETIRMLFGSGLGAVVALALVAEGAGVLRGDNQPIVARVLGSWIAATAILVLALRIATRLATG